MRILQLASGRKLSLTPGCFIGAATVSGDPAQDKVQSSKDREVTPYRRHGSSFAIHNVKHSFFDLQPRHDETLKNSSPPAHPSKARCCPTSV